MASSALAKASLGTQTTQTTLNVALSLWSGMVISGGIAGAALTANRSRGWLFGGVAGGIAVGGLIGAFGASMLVRRALAKEREELQLQKETTA